MILPLIGRAFIVLFVLVSPVFNVALAQTASPTLTPTVTPTVTPTPAPSNTTPYCASLTSDITNATGTPQHVTFTCAGVDPSGLIMAAEFVFGDGTSQIVEKNVGSPGSISVTHTYTTIGTLGASCRVRDNDNVYSPPGDACKKIVTIRPGTTKTPTVGATVTISPTPLNASPTAQLTATPTLIINPTLYPQDEATLVASDTSDNRIWWILGGIVSLILGFVLLRRKKHPMPPATPYTPQPPMPPVPPQPPAPPAA
jgi:hypothetical protein